VKATAEKQAITYTLTLTEQEAQDLLTVAGYDSTIPEALRKSKGGKADADRAEAFLPILYDVLINAGVSVL